ncbi:22095_t:CDS:1, partial [Gigaspora margarita]
HTSKIPDPISQIEPDTVNLLDQVSDMKCPALQTSQTDKYLSREEFEYFKALDLIEKDTILNTGIQFIQNRVSDSKRPHNNFKSLSNWKAIVPSTKNLAYRFIKPISDSKIYAEMPYMP